MKQVLTDIAKSIVDNPDEVSVSEKISGDTHVLELSVAKDDMGKVIGRQGKIAKALRTLVKASTKRGEKKYNIEIKSKTEI